MKKSLVCFKISLLIVVVAASHEYEGSHHHAYPQYQFEYGVYDAHTHDLKKQWEAREGNIVKGSYRLVQPDGRVRIVTYYADDKNGFNAEVKFEGKAHHPNPHRVHKGGSHSRGLGTAHTVSPHMPHMSHASGKAVVPSPASPNNFGYTIFHPSFKGQPTPHPTDHTFPDDMYTVEPISKTQNYNVGSDTQEPHGSELIFRS